MRNVSKLCLVFLLLLSSSSFAGQAELQFNTAGYERIQVLINGRLLNHSPVTNLSVRERPGMHRLKVRVFNRRGMLRQELYEKLHIRPHTRNQFIVESHPYKGSRLVRLSKPIESDRPVLRMPEPHRRYKPRLTLISDEAYFRLKDSMSLQRSDRDLLRTAKKELHHRLVYAGDVEELLYLFHFECSRLAFAKWAYRRVIDPENYERVYPVFRREESILQLKHYLRKRY